MSLSPIGWREWVSLPDLGVDWIKVKVDTGARSSSLHATHVERFERDGAPWARFEVHPWQGSARDLVVAEAPLSDVRSVRSSSGHAEDRPVIVTAVTVAARTWPIELTLTRRDTMGFRMLLGRQALRDRHVVDPGRSYLGGRPPTDVIRANRRAPRP